MNSKSDATYEKAGVDVDRAGDALKRITQRLGETWPTGGGIGSVALPFGYFANVIDLGGIGCAITADAAAQALSLPDTLQAAPLPFV